MTFKYFNNLTPEYFAKLLEIFKSSFDMQWRLHKRCFSSAALIARHCHCWRRPPFFIPGLIYLVFVIISFAEIYQNSSSFDAVYNKSHRDRIFFHDLTLY